MGDFKWKGRQLTEMQWERCLQALLAAGEGSKSLGREVGMEEGKGPSLILVVR